MRSFRSALLIAAATASIYGARPAFAQRADENALTSAEDAFGTTVGGETIGLYSATNARGFSPIRAGNLRLEGLFFDARGGGGGFVRLSNRLVGQSTIRVGLSAQSYPFPAPTGIADFAIRAPGDKYALSTVFRAAYPEAEVFELDTQIPLSERFSVGGGFSVERTTSDWALINYSLDGAIIGRWKVTDNFQFMPFYSRNRQLEGRWGPFLFAAGADLPPKYDRSKTLSQEWATFDNDDANFGMISRGRWDDWNLSVGIFRSISWRRGGENTQPHYRNIRANGDADLFYVRLAAQTNPNESSSGEARLTRAFVEGDRRHIVVFNTRAKRVQNGYGGNVTRLLGTGNILRPFDWPTPTFAAGRRGREYIRQYTGGVSYQLLWRNIGEFSAGLQRTNYTRFTRFVDPTPAETTNEWLYNATLAAYLSDKLVLYSGYTRGLEDSPRAPPFAVNAGASASATVTQQIDGGLRYTIIPGLTFVAGVYQVEKPFFDLDTTGFFRRLGDVRHRGYEVSLSGSPLAGLTVVTGVVGIEPRLSGVLVDTGVMGPIPPDTVPVTALFSAQYGPKTWNGFSLDGRINYSSAYNADVLNTFKSVAVTTVDIGGRYRFQLADNNALLRLQVQNLFDVWEWNVQGTQRELRATQRRKVQL